MSEPTVTIAEIAAAMGRKVEHVEREAAELGMLVRPDWAGRRSLSVADARGLASGAARRNLEHSRAWGKHQRDTKAWVAGRSRAISDAAARVRATAGKRGSGIVSLQAREAAVEAARRYEERTPRPSFNGVYSVNLEYVEEVSA